MTEPSVSAVITAHNAAAFLAESISSVLAQEVPADQVIVIDDGSTDATGRLARRFPVHYVRQARRLGKAVARNRGVELARAEFIAFLDAGDLWLPARLRCQLAAFADDPSLDLVGGHAVPLEQGLALFEPAPEQTWSALLVRREAFLKVGPLYTGPDLDETVDWFVRARRAGLQMGMVPDVVLRRREATSPVHQDLFPHRRAA